MANLAAMLTNAPIPGQGLTQAKDAPLPYERPTKQVSFEGAIDSIFEDLTSRRKLPSVMKVFRSKKVFIDRLASAYIEQGLIEGRWNTDLAHLLVEPVLFIFMWLASQADAPVRFKFNRAYNSGGMDLLEGLDQEAVSEQAQSLLAPTEEGAV